MLVSPLVSQVLSVTCTYHLKNSPSKPVVHVINVYDNWQVTKKTTRVIIWFISLHIDVDIVSGVWRVWLICLYSERWLSSSPSCSSMVYSVRLYITVSHTCMVSLCHRWWRRLRPLTDLSSDSDINNTNALSSPKYYFMCQPHDRGIGSHAYCQDEVLGFQLDLAKWQI